MIVRDIRASTTTSATQEINISEVNSFFSDRMVTKEKDLSEITYFVCIKILSESLGKLNNKVYRHTDKGIIEVEHPLNSVIGLRPNPYMTAAMYNATVEYYRNHYGNAFVWIERGHDRSGKIYTKALYPLNPDHTTILIDNKGLLGAREQVYIRYIEPRSGRQFIFSYEDVLHYRSSIISADGFSGMAIRDILHNTLDAKKDADSLNRNIYRNGVTGKAVLEYVGDIDDKAEKRLIKKIEEYATGTDNYGKFIPLPLGMKMTPLNINLESIQFLEIKKFTALEVASAFGIKPNQLNNYEKSSYSNSESQNLSFYVDTLLYILNSYEQEDTHKLLSSNEIKQGYFTKRNVKGILRCDFKSQIESLVSGVTTGIYNINEARHELNLPDTEGGDTNIVNGTYISIKDVGKQYKIDKNGDDNNG
jgi:HK97 family phage portal protein|nr:MAG TPA: portal protein [Caudoviricetes sp.]DAT63648.1 MAG TPA: portal protein [Caudoviricetes sp.]